PGRHELRQPHRRRGSHRPGRCFRRHAVEPSVPLAGGPGRHDQRNRSGGPRRADGQVRRPAVKRALLLLLALAGCFGSPRPVIQSFTVDEQNPDARAAVEFSYVVFGAQTVRIDPYPGEVHGSPVTVYPLVSTTFTLRAFNDDGVEASANLSLNVRAPFEIETADVSPGQVAPGADVTLSW